MSCLDHLKDFHPFYSFYDFYGFYGFYDLPLTAYCLPLTTGH